MSSEKPVKRLIFRWTALKGLAAILLFFILALIIESVMVFLFQSSGLRDEFLMSQAFQVPGTSFSLTITISPIFHLMPLGVIVVLVSSWTYLTKYIAVAPRRISAPRRTPETRRRRDLGAKKVRFKRIRQSFKRLNRRLRGIGRRMSSAFRRIRGVSYVLQRLSFAKATVKGATTVLLVFLTSAFALSLLVYPSLIHDRVVGLYGANPSFHGFILETLETVRVVGGFFSSIDNALHAAAPGFRNSLEGFGTAISEPLVKLDIVWKYAVCQNVAAWISAVVALTYGQYASQKYRSYKR